MIEILKAKILKQPSSILMLAHFTKGLKIPNG